MIANRPPVLRYTLAAILLAAAVAVPRLDTVETGADLDIEMSAGEGTYVVPEMTQEVRAFYATRDPGLAPRVQAWLTESHEGEVEVGDTLDVIQLSRRAQLAACLAIDPHGGELRLSIVQTGDTRGMSADGSNADVVECVETIASSLRLAGEGKLTAELEYAGGRLVDTGHVQVERSPRCERELAIAEARSQGAGWGDRPIRLFWRERATGCTLLDATERAQVDVWLTTDATAEETFAHGSPGAPLRYAGPVDDASVHAWAVRALQPKLRACAVDAGGGGSPTVTLRLQIDGVGHVYGTLISATEPDEQGPACLGEILSAVEFPPGDERTLEVSFRYSGWRAGVR